MREILFRAKSVNELKWVEGFYVREAGHFIKELPSAVTTPIHLVYHETVGQFTGLTDKNGRKIFEGDFVLGRFEFGMNAPSLVVFCDGAFGLEWEHAGKKIFTAFTRFFNVNYEVVGNVFDNPELLLGEA